MFVFWATKITIISEITIKTIGNLTFCSVFGTKFHFLTFAPPLKSSPQSYFSDS